MPLTRRWPFWVSQTVLNDRRAALDDLHRASGGLRAAAERAERVERVASAMRRTRERGGLSGAVGALLAGEIPPIPRPRPDS
jgi:hypothetical protein